VNFNQSAPKRPVNLNLNADHVERCVAGIGHVSPHGAALPPTDLTQRHAVAEAERIRTERELDVFAAHYYEHGSLSEEIQSL
jgi:hypothetical protein